MSRNTSGTYTLPAGNPVVSGTTVSSSWANSTLSDLATELTNSLDRSGRGAMSAPLKLTDGTAAAPALAFSSDPDTGLYRVGENICAAAAGGTQVQRWETTGTVVTGNLSTSAPLVASGTAQPAGNVFSVAPIGTAGTENHPLGGFRTQTTGQGNTILLTTRVRNVAAGGGWTRAELGLSYDVDATVGAGAQLWLGETIIKATRSLAFDGVTNPLATQPFRNTLTPKNVVKAWANIVNNAGALLLSEGFNVASVTYPASNTIRVTFAQAMANAAYACLVIPERIAGVPMVAPTIARTLGSVDIVFYDAGNGIIATATQVFTFSLLVLGVQ